MIESIHNIGHEIMNDREILEVFNEKAETLQEFERLLETLNKTKVGFKESADHNYGEAILEGPNKESVHACILNIRFFMQDNEKISVRNLSKIYERFSTPAKNDFNSIRQSLNDFLDSPSPLSKSISPTASLPENIDDINNDIFKIIDFINSSEVIFYTNREIFEAFIYGDLSHQTKREEYKRLSGAYGQFAVFVFWNILRNFIQHMFDIKELNDRVLSELDS